MTDPTIIAARRYSELHPGYYLVDAVDAAIPFSWLGLDLLVQERRTLPVVDEFVLRLCQQNVNTIGEIAAVLGVDEEVVQVSVAGQLSQENIDYRPIQRTGHPPEQMIALTPDGARTVTTLETTAPTRADLGWGFDRLTWAPSTHPNADLVSLNEANTRGMVLLPSSRTSDVATADVTPRALNRLMGDTGGDRPRGARPDVLEVLSVETITRQPRRWLPVVLLVFRATDFDDTRLAVVVDDLDSTPHSQALLKAGGMATLRLTVAPSIGEPELPPELLAQRVPYDTVRGLQRRADTPLISGEAESTANDDSVTARAELAALTVRAVPSFEHPELLDQAIGETRRRFLLIAPRLHDAVVTDDLIANLENMLRRTGLTAAIAYGPGQSDATATERLTRLGRRFSNLTLTHLATQRHHVLIFDDTWINTSFDWLSHRGSTTPTLRREEGTLIHATQIVNDRYTHYRTLAEKETS